MKLICQSKLKLKKLGSVNLTKFSILVCCCALFVSSEASSAGHEALEALFANGSNPLKTEKLCEPYQLADMPTINSQTLAQDIAWVLADMSEKSINIESACEINQRSAKLCKVIFSVSEGELEWARVYQFESVSAKNGGIRIQNLECFNLP